MANRIQCSYDDCDQSFDSVEAMKKHKARDLVHDFYCKRCDEDCEEDEEYLLHQIISPKHICCPICGQEFQSEGGRKRHVTISHRAKQNLKCPACEKKFTAASAFMKHIEDDSCEFIKREHFLRQRAEKQIKEDAKDAAIDPYGDSTVLTATATRTDTGLGSTTGNVLGDRERVHIHHDWDGNAGYNYGSELESQPTSDHTSGGATLEMYPPLPLRTKSQSHVQKSFIEPNADLLDVNKDPQIIQGTRAQASMHCRSGGDLNNSPLMSTNLLDNLELSIENRLGSSQITVNRDHQYVPPAKPASNQDPNAPFARIRTTTVDHRAASKLHIERFHNAITGLYICPGSKCDRKFQTVEEFQNHLLTGVHAVSQVQCPCCYKRFKTTHALVAHCESGSMKCKIRETVDFDKVMRTITAGMLAVNGYMDDGSTSYTAVPIELWGE